MIAVVGAAGFIGSALTRRLLSEGLGDGRREGVRVLVRDEGRARARLGITDEGRLDVVVGDMQDDAALDAVLAGVDAVYVLVQTVTARQPSGSGDFARAEARATQRLVAAARRAGTRRLLTVGLIGARPEARNPWVRSRAAVERQLLGSGLDVTVLRPGLVAGPGGTGFDDLLAAARRRTAVIRGAGRQHWSWIALDDLVGYLIDALDEPSTYGRVLDVGTAEAPTYRELVAATAAALGRSTPHVVGLPIGVLQLLAPLLERAGGHPHGGLRAALNHLADDLTGDPMPIRELLPRELLDWDACVRAAVDARARGARPVGPGVSRAGARRVVMGGKGGGGEGGGEG
ncbi:MAG: hypothetical protein BGO38_15990 [Cellulomonas sp. 73-145]|uniref:SDR family oxidoreductase n=1 Tax=Cellulomonas sp. 73-145 TaxID=1895739 RepID=UPI000925A5B3|nr:NAD(P)H-binding protein [Cellulomonas sp. 73-145]MBN9326545.1 NAD(P)H-binding protein [Cellulomonas sp.]OJV58845.1 MAG: hypothetical protein BGO38_15990 [Cellulomonas sp. 73-145]